ncbi:hypothetical protein DL96DRAFT_1703627 [Flagelloscypha sp. PMI_526]|nr:hypothetical protein DL96DRAFT_1703627 [Flagelloscypha sp. PMI_526]
MLHIIFNPFFFLFEHFYQPFCLVTRLIMNNWPVKLNNLAKGHRRKLTSEETTGGAQNAPIHTVTYFVCGVEFGKASASTLSKARMDAAEKAHKALDVEING